MIKNIVRSNRNKDIVCAFCDYLCFLYFLRIHSVFAYLIMMWSKTGILRRNLVYVCETYYGTFRRC